MFKQELTALYASLIFNINWWELKISDFCDSYRDRKASASKLNYIEIT